MKRKYSCLFLFQIQEFLKVINPILPELQNLAKFNSNLFSVSTILVGKIVDSFSILFSVFSGFYYRRFKCD